MIDGYTLAAEAELRRPDRPRQLNAERDGRWKSSALKLWTAEHRRDHFGGPVGAPFEVDPPPLLDNLCRALSAALASSEY